MPRLRPPYPATHGYEGRPTLIHNVETLAQVPGIVARGGEWFASLGEPGARLWSISGAVEAPGCYEAPVGTTIADLVARYGGGPTDGIGAVLFGGAAGVLLPSTQLEARTTADALTPLDATAGSGAVMVFPDGTDVVGVVAEVQRFFAAESCQKCTPCRIGTRLLHRTMSDLGDGGVAADHASVGRWLDVMEQGSICGLGTAAPSIVRSAMRWWPDRFARLGVPAR